MEHIDGVTKYDRYLDLFRTGLVAAVDNASIPLLDPHQLDKLVEIASKALEAYDEQVLGELNSSNKSKRQKRKRKYDKVDKAEDRVGKSSFEQNRNSISTAKLPKYPYSPDHPAASTFTQQSPMALPSSPLFSMGQNTALVKSIISETTDDHMTDQEMSFPTAPPLLLCSPADSARAAMDFISESSSGTGADAKDNEFLYLNNSLEEQGSDNTWWINDQNTTFGLGESLFPEDNSQQ
jgi:hypothetical protein